MLSYGSNIKDYLDKIDIEKLKQEKEQEQDIQFRFIVTQLCNEFCFFCHNEGLPIQNKFMDFEFFKQIINAIKTLKYSDRLRFTGGEPLLHKKIKDFIIYARKHLPNTNIGITTNGLLIKKRLKDILEADPNNITISLHTLNEDKFKYITGINGLKIVLDGLLELKKTFQGKISINSVISEINYDEIGNLFDFSKEHGFYLKFMDILTYNNKNLQQVLDAHIHMDILKRKINEDIFHSLKQDRTPTKCKECDQRKVCGHEASYLRISPDKILNPCLGLKNFDIPLEGLEGEYLEKAISLGVYRTQKLNL